MKQIVMEQLRIRELEYLFSEKLFNQYVSKARRYGTGGNKYLIALNVFDMFILNATAAA